jgi:hypothetical protein
LVVAQSYHTPSRTFECLITENTELTISHDDQGVGKFLDLVFMHADISCRQAGSVAKAKRA